MPDVAAVCGRSSICYSLAASRAPADGAAVCGRSSICYSLQLAWQPRSTRCGLRPILDLLQCTRRSLADASRLRFAADPRFATVAARVASAGRPLRFAADPRFATVIAGSHRARPLAAVCGRSSICYSASTRRHRAMAALRFAADPRFATVRRARMPSAPPAAVCGRSSICYSRLASRAPAARRCGLRPILDLLQSPSAAPRAG